MDDEPNTIELDWGTRWHAFQRCIGFGEDAWQGTDPQSLAHGLVEHARAVRSNHHSGIAQRFAAECRESRSVRLASRSSLRRESRNGG